MPRIQLIHGDAARVEMLRAAGYEVAPETPLVPGFLRQLRQDPPDAVVIGLDTRPSMGRDIGVGIRHAKATRHVPLVFAGGDPERVRQVLPDAVYTPWSRIRGALKQAIAHPPADPVAPKSIFAAYSGTPLAKKLGIKPDSVVALVGAPDDFQLPAGVEMRGPARGSRDLTLRFVRSARDLAAAVTSAPESPLWIVWPKKTSALASELTQQQVREAGLAAGLVDYKICAIDATWSGLLFRQRRATMGKK